MSATEDLALVKWERAKRIGYYNCRVVFGVYASRLLSVAPKPKANNPNEDEKPKAPPAWLADGGAEAEENLLFGFKLRRMLNKEKLALVDWNRGSDRRGEYHITYTTCARSDLERMASWDDDKPMELPLHKLVARGHAMARQKVEECIFEELIINPCRDDRSKHFASLYFGDDRDDIAIDLLLNGASTKTTRLSVTEEQYKELSEYGIPKIREQDGADQSATAPESKPEGKKKPKPESKVRPQ
jgi:hypothetical protein